MTGNTGEALSVADALAIVLAHARPLAPISCDLANVLGLVLAHNILADIDLPPFDKSIVDGYAVRSTDFSGSEGRELTILEEIYAGRTPTLPVGPGQATSIMTGAPLPDGADAVVMVEKCERISPWKVKIFGPVRPGQNRLPRGREMRAGDIVVPRGEMIDAAKLGVLASVGASTVPVHPRPTVAVIATGDELVPHQQTPGPGQIRNSNSLLLQGLVREHGAIPVVSPIIPDEGESLRAAFRQATAPLAESGQPAVDILLISGGVSAGKKDLVPEALEAVGVRPLFHKVRVKPGKPLWFGVGPEQPSGRSTLVFGLPGNPVSGLVSFLLFVRPAIRVLQGLGDRPDPTITLPLLAEYRQLDDRDTLRPARLVKVAGAAEPSVQPLDFAGSSDLRGVAMSDGFAHFPSGEKIYQSGDRIGFVPLDYSRFGLERTY